jgi:NAD(P)-dependent dehydrogenase (short-subunit alcohol dehydrogenase family)
MENTKILNSFGEDLNVAVIGSSGGIGRALVDLLVAQTNVERVFCLSRSKPEFNQKKTEHIIIDITCEQSIRRAAGKISSDKLDIIICATGFLHSDQFQPEKSLRDLNMDNFKKVFAINTFGPALVAKHFLPLIPRRTKSVFAALSARVGSIEDNRLGGWYAYRASKSALNMLIKNTSIETQRRFKQASVIGLHPGTVDTGLSKPFQTNVAANKLFDADFSAQCLLQVINLVTPTDSGQIFAWDGKKIPY